MKQKWIMVAGPYRGGASNEKERQANLDFLNKAAYEVFKKGHIPIIGVNVALPIIKVMGDNHYDEIMMPICLPLIEKCDAVLRIGGESQGADQEVEKFAARGLPVYLSIEEVPVAIII
ncbi:MAG: DUF1937 family protein [Bdellovibrionota bacterium]